MSGRVVSFFKRTVSRDWSTQELAEFYRVEAALLQSGLRVSLDRGITDEGDPWFVFCRAEDDEVIVHFARIDGRYLISAPSFGGNATGQDFSALVRDLVARNPVLRPTRRDENVTLHPSALLVLLVASALLKMSHAAEAAAAERPAGAAVADPHTAPAPIRVTIAGVEHTADLVSQETQQYVAMLSVIALGAGPLDNLSMPVFVVSAPPPDQSSAVHVPASSHALPEEWSVTGGESGADGAGGGSITPPPVPPLLSTPDGSAHAHDAAIWQMQPAPIGSGANPLADVAAAISPTAPVAAPPAPPPVGSPVAPVANPGLIQGNHDLASSLLQVFGGSEPIVHSDTLPTAFIAPLQSSVHTSAATLATPESHGAAPVAATPLMESSSPLFVSGGPGPAAAGMGSGASAADTSFGAAPSAIATSLPGPGTTEFVAVLSIMQNFAQVVGSHLAILVSGNQVIEYDYFAVDYTPTAVSAVTYDFTDGSHVSLVGLRSELPHTAV